MKQNWIHLKIEFETLKDGVKALENRIGNIGKWNRKHWKMELRTLENSIDNIGKWN